MQFILSGDYSADQSASLIPMSFQKEVLTLTS